jgi:hypothetical protein
MATSLLDELFGGGGASFGNPNIQRQGAKARALAAQRDVNTLPDPRTYAAVSGLLGTAPDEMGFSVLNPEYESIMQTARPAFAAGTALGVAPFSGKALPAAGRSLGPIAAGMAEGYLQRQGLMAGIVPTGGKAASKIDEITGLPLNPDGTVTLFHHTNKTAAEQIAKSGRLKSAGEPSVYLTTQKATDTGYGDVAVPVRVKPSMLNLDDQFPSGRMDFSIDTGKPKGSVPVTVEKQSFQYPQDEAMRLAQQRAALPVEQGLPSPQSLTMPSVPTVEQMQQYGRTEVVPLSKAVSFQSARRWDEFNAGKGPGDLVPGFGDKPLALRLENGEYVIYDGNHRTDLAMQKGQTELPMNVIDVKSYDPAHAGRKPVPDKMSADDLLSALFDEGQSQSGLLNTLAP